MWPLDNIERIPGDGLHHQATSAADRCWLCVPELRELLKLRFHSAAEPTDPPPCDAPLGKARHDWASSN
jgi:hypothetical protein